MVGETLFASSLQDKTKVGDFSIMKLHSRLEMFHHRDPDPWCYLFYYLLKKTCNVNLVVYCCTHTSVIGY
jgi:hypothetical protein